jgi:hypothetical protein
LYLFIKSDICRYLIGAGVTPKRKKKYYELDQFYMNQPYSREKKKKLKEKEEDIV